MPNEAYTYIFLFLIHLRVKRNNRIRNACTRIQLDIAELEKNKSKAAFYVRECMYTDE